MQCSQCGYKTKEEDAAACGLCATPFRKQDSPADSEESSGSTDAPAVEEEPEPTVWIRRRDTRSDLEAGSAFQPALTLFVVVLAYLLFSSLRSEFSPQQREQEARERLRQNAAAQRYWAEEEGRRHAIHGREGW